MIKIFYATESNIKDSHILCDVFITNNSVSCRAKCLDVFFSKHKNNFPLIIFDIIEEYDEEESNVN